MPTTPSSRPLIPLWGGLEATVNRVGDRFQDQFEWSGHDARLSDLDLVANLGVRVLRIPVLWERVEPGGPEGADWTYSDGALGRLRDLDVKSIVGLVHHGSGPRSTDLLDPEFPAKLAAYARRVAERYPWVDDYSPVNEPLTTARFSALYGHWYPHAHDDRSFVRALLNQVRAVILAMREIRRVNPRARLVQTDDLGKTHSTPLLRYQADLENERRWITWDLLCGRLDRSHRMWRYLVKHGATEEELEWFVANPRRPDVIGVNHYISSERFLDHQVEHHRPEAIGGNGRHEYADVLAARIRREGCDGFEGVLTEAWERFHLPLAVTECHMGCTREEQLRWLVDGWEAAHRVRDAGAEIVGFTAWSMFGAFDWDSLLTEWKGHYEPGAFDLRGPSPRPTALAAILKSLGEGKTPEHPALAGPGWWERDIRFQHPPVSTGPRNGSPLPREILRRPILITGKGGMLATALAQACELRGLDYHALSRAELDIADPEAVARAMEVLRPWAVVNAAGHVREEATYHDAARCYRSNTAGAAVLATACQRFGARLVTFTSDWVFDGGKGEPYDETDKPSPRGVYGLSQREAERCALHIFPESLIVRTSALFGSQDSRNAVYRALGALAQEQSLGMDAHRVISPTYVPDLVHAALDLLIDAEAGVWHLANHGSVRFDDFVGTIALAVGLDAPETSFASVVSSTPLVSRRGNLLPSWQDAVERYVADLSPRINALRRFTWR